MDAADDAKVYKGEQQLETDRQRIREANRLLKAKGERPLKLPQKPKRGSTSCRRRRDSYDDSEDDGDSLYANDLFHPRDPRDFVYEGREFKGEGSADSDRGDP